MPRLIKVEHEKSYDFRKVLDRGACPDCGKRLDWEPDSTATELDFGAQCQKCEISFFMTPATYMVELDRW